MNQLIDAARKEIEAGKFMAEYFSFGVDSLTAFRLAYVTWYFPKKEGGRRNPGPRNNYNRETIELEVVILGTR